MLVLNMGTIVDNFVYFVEKKHKDKRVVNAIDKHGRETLILYFSSIPIGTLSCVYTKYFGSRTTKTEHTYYVFIHFKAIQMVISNVSMLLNMRAFKNV